MLVGLLTAATNGYGYGLSVSALHLPEILRTLDASYLANDFWLNAQDGFGPRFYYRLAFAAVALAVPLWLAYAAAFVLAAVATSVATALAARDLAGSALAACVAVPLVMWAVPFRLANWPAIFNANSKTAGPSPQVLAEPLCFFALWRGIRGRPIEAAAFSVPAILLHPTVGLGSAAVALAAALVRLWRRPAGGPRRRDALAFAAAAGTVTVVAVACWIVPGVLSGAIFTLDASEVVRLVAHVRHPHHLVPSTWPVEGFLRAAVFWGAGALALAGWQRRRGEPAAKDGGTTVAVAAALVAVGCGLVCGWFFVEVVPSRWAATAYLFRLRSLATWLCWIVLAAMVAAALQQSWLRVRAWRGRAAPRLIAWLEGPPLRWAGLACLALLLFGVSAGIALRGMHWLPDTSLPVRAAVRVARILNAPQPVFTLREAGPLMGGMATELAEAARRETPPDAVFLLPRHWRFWRLQAERAVVVNRAFAFREDQMQAWHDRYIAVFDLERGVGYPVRATERWLRKLWRTVPFDYAVVPRSSCLRWRTVATSGNWKLVAVPL